MIVEHHKLSKKRVN